MEPAETYPVVPASNSIWWIIGNNLAFNLHPEPFPPFKEIVGSSKKSNPVLSILIFSTFPSRDKFILAPVPNLLLIEIFGGVKIS